MCLSFASQLLNDCSLMKENCEYELKSIRTTVEHRSGNITVRSCFSAQGKVQPHHSRVKMDETKDLDLNFLPSVMKKSLSMTQNIQQRQPSSGLKVNHVKDRD